MPSLIRIIVCGCLFVLGAGGHATPIVPIPDHIDGATTMTAEQLLILAETQPELVIVDSRIPEDRMHGYIEHSVSLPDIDTDCDSLAEVIPTKATPTVFFCNGVKCGRSVVALRIALTCGYTNLYWFRGGFEEWRDKRFLYLHE